MKGWLDKYQVGGQANKWQVSPKAVAANKAARQPMKDIDAAASNALEKVTSYPQRKATELITGKNQYPAEAMGITNPLGVILANSILDPANLLGVGEVKAASKLLKGAKGAKKVTNVADNIMQHITQDELMDVFPTLTSSSNNMTDVQRATQRAELRRRMRGWDQEMNNTSTAIGERSPIMGLSNLPGSSVTPSPPGGLMGLTTEEVARTWENYVPMDFSSNWNLPKKTLLSKLKDKAGKAVSVVDKKLGEMVSPPRKLPKGVSIGKLSNEINEELIKGVGVKKEQYPLRIALSGDLDRLTAGTQIINPATNKIENVGQISLSRLTKPYGSKKFSEILFPDKNPTSTTPRDVWSNTLGFAKETDFPFGNLPKDEQLMFHHLGISGEYNKAINEVLKRNNLGNVLSGGTGHTDLGLERWKKLANKGLAEDFGDKFYKLKKDGGWLEKYNDGGPIQPNYNDYSVSAGPGFEGDGYSNVGRNYSPAWGGQFQMGGSLPGATGFMYARVGAPSNGKYAKKTKASAQDGTMLSNQDASTYVKIPNKQEVDVLKSAKSDIINEGNSTNRLRMLKNAVRHDMSMEQFKPLEDIDEVTLNKRTLELANKKEQNLNNPRVEFISGNGISKNDVLGYFNPNNSNGVITLSNNISNINELKETSRHEYRHAYDDAGKLLTNYEKQFIGNKTAEGDVDKIKAIGRDQYKYLTNPTEITARLQEIRGGLKDAKVYDASKDKATLEHLNSAKNISGYQDLLKVMKPQDVVDLLNTIASNNPKQGMPIAQNGAEMKFYQEGLDFKPKTISRDGNNVAYADNTRVGAVPRYTRPSNYQGNQPDTLGENIFEIVDPSGVSSWDDIYRSYNKTGMSDQTGIEAFGAIPMLGKLKKAGQFLDIIGKGIPKTGRQARNLKASVNTIKAVGKYGPTAGRATDAIQAYTQRNEYEEGGVIQDDMGQWAHPGEITEIGSNQITMQGVPYPVMGISDTGDMQMMYPNQEYQYDGESVTEYPMMAEGGKVATDTSMPRMVKTNKKSSLINKQEELPLYYGPNVFENCVGAGCSKLATTETANLYGVSYDALSPQDAWYKKAAVLKDKGKQIWDPSKPDYSGVKVGDFVSMDRFGHDHDRDVSPIKGFTLADNEKVEHVGTVIGRNEQGIPLIKHGSEHGKVYVQPITDLVLPDANDVNIPLYYKPKSIYRSSTVENLDLKNKKYYTKPGKIDPIVWQNPTEAPTENEKKYLDAINKNAPMQQLVYGLTPEETKRINEVSWGIFHNETKAGATSKPVGGKMIAASLLHAFGRDNAASLGDVQIKYDDLMFNKDGSISKTGRLMQEMGVNRDGLYSPLEHRKDYNDEVNSVAAALATSLDKIKNNPTKYKYNPDKNTVYGNIPVDEALATIYRLGAVGFKESALRKHLSYGKAAATHVNRDIEPSKKPIVNVGGQPLFAKLPKKEQGGQLTKLDQLTNFTNYNTKQPGGWLDKYQ